MASFLDGSKVKTHNAQIQERGRKLYRSCLETIKRLDDITKEQKVSTDLFSSESVLIRNRLTESLEKLLFLSPVEYGKRAEELLWRKIFYDVIQILKQNKKEVLINKSLQSLFHIYLSTAYNFYKHLIFRLQKTYLPNLSGVIDWPFLKKPLLHVTSKTNNFEVNSQTISWAKSAVHRALICLGDISRYELELDASYMHECIAKRYYHQAIIIEPTNGMPHNQLGTLAGNKYYFLEATYHYMFCMICDHPFEGTIGNLKRIILKNNQMYREIFSGKSGRTTNISDHSYRSNRRIQSNTQNSSTNDSTIINETQKFIVGFLKLIGTFLDISQKGGTASASMTKQVHDLCQETLQQFNICMFDNNNIHQQQGYSEEMNKKVKEPQDTKDLKNKESNTTLLIRNEEKITLNDEMIFMVVIICFITISHLESSANKLATAATAFTLAFISSLLNHVTIRIQGFLDLVQDDGKKGIVNGDCSTNDLTESSSSSDSIILNTVNAPVRQNGDLAAEKDEQPTNDAGVKQNLLASPSNNKTSTHHLTTVLDSRKRMKNDDGDDDNSSISDDNNDSDRSESPSLIFTSTEDDDETVERDATNDDKKAVAGRMLGRRRIHSSVSSCESEGLDADCLPTTLLSLEDYSDDDDDDRSENSNGGNMIFGEKTAETSVEKRGNQMEQTANSVKMSSSMDDEVVSVDQNEICKVSTKTPSNTHDAIGKNLETDNSELIRRTEIEKIVQGKDNNGTDDADLSHRGNGLVGIIGNVVEENGYSLSQDDSTSSKSTSSNECKHGKTSSIPPVHQQPPFCREDKLIHRLLGTLLQEKSSSSSSSLLGTVKLVCDWLRHRRELMKTCAENCQSLWARLSVLLNLLPTQLELRTLLYNHHRYYSFINSFIFTDVITKFVNDDNDGCLVMRGNDVINEDSDKKEDKKDTASSVITSWKQTLPLVEDRIIRGLKPLKSTLDELDFEHSKLLSSYQEVLLRICCLRNFGHFVAREMNICFTYDSFSNTFIGPIFTEPSTTMTGNASLNNNNASSKIENTDSRGIMEALTKRQAQQRMADEETRRNQLMRDMAQLRLESEVRRLEGELRKSSNRTRSSSKNRNKSHRRSKNIVDLVSRFSKESSVDDNLLSEPLDFNDDQQQILFPPYLVIDGYSMACNLSKVKKLVSSERFILVVPLSVIGELDVMKSGLAESAAVRTTIRWLESEFRKGHRYVRAQKSHEKCMLPLPRNLKRRDRQSWNLSHLLACAKYLVDQAVRYGAKSTNIAAILTTNTPSSVDLSANDEHVNINNNGDSFDHKPTAKILPPLFNVILQLAHKEGVSVQNFDSFYKQWLDYYDEGG